MTIAPLKTTGKLKNLDEAGRASQGITKPRKSPVVIISLILLAVAFILLITASVVAVPFLGAYAGLSVGASLVFATLSLRE